MKLDLFAVILFLVGLILLTCVIITPGSQIITSFVSGMLMMTGLLNMKARN